MAQNQSPTDTSGGQTSAADTAKAAAKETAAVAKEKLNEAKQVAQNVAAEQVDGLKAKAGETIQDAKRQATAKAQEARDTVASEGDALADGLRRTASDLHSDTLHARGLEQVADTVSYAANAVRETDIEALIDDISGYAQRNPLIFLAGAAALGFVATRFLKSSQPGGQRIAGPRGDRPQGQPDWARPRG